MRKKLLSFLILAVLASWTTIVKAQCDYSESFSDPATVKGTLGAAPSQFNYLVDADATLTFWCNAAASGSRNTTFTFNNPNATVEFTDKAHVEFDWGVRSCRSGGGDGFVAFRDESGQTIFALSTKHTSSNTAGQPIEVGVGPTIDIAGVDVIAVGQKTTLDASVLSSAGGAVATGVDPAWFHVSIDVDMVANTVTFTLTGINGTTGTATATVPLAAGFVLQGGFKDIQMGVSRPDSNSPWWGTKITNICIKNVPVTLLPTIALTSGSSNQTVATGSAIGNIVYTWGGSATEADVVWTPAGVPAGLVVTPDANAKTVTISGTPTVAGTYTYSITSTDGTATSSQLTGTITVSQALPLLALTSGANNQTVTAESAIGNIVYTWSGSATGANVVWTPAGVPAGIVVTPDANAKTVTISGTPTVAGTYTYSITSTDGTAVSDPLTGTITVSKLLPQIALTSGTNNQSLIVGDPVANIVCTWSGSATEADLVWTSAEVPTGIVVTPDANSKTITISGKPEAAGTYTYSIMSTDGTAVSDPITGTITVYPYSPLIFLTSGSDDQTVTAFDPIEDIVCTWNGTATGAGVVWSPAGVPAGIVVTKDADSKTITISGAPEVVGTYAYHIISTDGTDVSDPVYGLITVSPLKPLIALTSGSNNQAITAGDPVKDIVYTWSGSATEANVVWTPAGVPAGIVVTPDADSKTVTISGAPKVAGTYAYSITSTDGTDVSSPLTGTITVNAPVISTCDYFEDFATSANGAVSGQILAYNGADQTLTFDVENQSGSRKGIYTLANGGVNVTTQAVVNFDFYTTSFFNGTGPFVLSFRDANDITLFSVYTNNSGGSTKPTTFGVASGPLDGSVSATDGAPVAGQNADMTGITMTGITTGNWFHITAVVDLVAKNIQFTVTGINGTDFSNEVTIALPASYSLSGGIQTIVFNGIRVSSNIYGIFKLTNLCIKNTASTPQLPTIALTSGSNNQTVSVESAIADIVYTWGGSATGADVVWTPAGTPAGIVVTPDDNLKTVTISGTPEAIGTYAYSITSTDGTAVSDPLTGTITVATSDGLKVVNPDNDKIISIHYYNLEGIEISQPVENNFYIVKKVFESKKSEISKIYYKR